MERIKKDKLEGWKRKELNFPGISWIYIKTINANYTLVLTRWERNFITIDLHKDNQLYKSIDLDDYDSLDELVKHLTILYD